MAVTVVTLILSMTPLFDVAMLTTGSPLGISLLHWITRYSQSFCEVNHSRANFRKRGQT